MSEAIVPTKLDRSRLYGIVYGSDEYKYAQDGVLYDAAGAPVRLETKVVHPKKKVENPKMVSDGVASASAFLKTLLKGGAALPKSVVYAEADNNNQKWEDVTEAAVDTVKRFSVKNVELWKLVE